MVHTKSIRAAMMANAGPGIALPPSTHSILPSDETTSMMGFMDDDPRTNDSSSHWNSQRQKQKQHQHQRLRFYPLSLNLRQYGALTARDLDMLPSSLEHLSMGPYFSPSLTVTQIVEKLPIQSLTHLDLDLSKCHWPHVANKDNNETVARLLLGRCCGSNLEHLGLRLRPPPSSIHNDGDSSSASIIDDARSMPGDGLARAVASHWLHLGCGTSATRRLQSLTLHGNLIGDAGVQVLVQAFTSDSDCSSGIRYLNLSHNLLSSVSCQVIASFLASPHCYALHSLDLSHNPGVDVEGILVLLDALRANTSLRHLSCYTECGRGVPLLRQQQQQLSTVYPHLLDILEHDNSSLHSVRLSAPQPGGDDENDDDTVTCIQQKIATLLLLNRTGRTWLSTTDSTVPAGLWPHILARAERIEQQESTANNNNNSGSNDASGANSVFFLLRNTVGQVWAVGDDAEKD